MNISDLMVQLLMFIFIIGIFFAVFFVVRSLLTKQPSQTNSIEQKLDRIIELLDKEN
ncbi:DUF4083 family protein [Cytobacillus dafuensis]|uniref:DUF4083 domain-containing protein n=1 Tax=Cytobacillus dafuensis TaxID=1742359 RepID=A0A5B8Z431_CYTDA|nr:DUF4083 family protein [Cytobacillus dafuensis]QED47627.1 DUF4083 domain-containing protein [Cytobacillus dafuensis]